MRLLSHFLGRARQERELDDELRFYVDELAESNARAGMAADEALRAAKIQFGGIEQVKEHVRDARSGAWLDSVLQDIRYAARGLWNHPGFALVVVLSLAAGIGANSALFSVINAVMLRTLPLAHPEELYVVNIEGPAARSNELFSYPMFEQMRSLAQKNKGHMAAMSRIARMRVLADGERDQETGFIQLVSGEFFAVAELTPALGRFLTPEDNRIVGGHPVAVISDDFWRRRFGGSRTVLGRGLALNGSHFTIVGVAPRRFTGMWLESRADIWIPVMMQASVHYAQNFSEANADSEKPWPPQDGIRWLNLVVRAHSNVGVLAALFQQRSARQADDISNAERRRIFLERRLTVLPMARGLSDLRAHYTAPLFALMAMVGVVLLIACANAASLLLARARRRQREMAVRLSLGAGRGRLIRQLLTESFLLAAIASAAGLAAAHFASELLVRRALGVTAGPAPFPTSVDARVLWFTIALSVVTTFLFGLAPAFRATHIELEPALRAVSRSIHDGARFNLQKLFVVAQIALTLILVVGSFWLAASLRNLANVDLGYTKDRVITVSINPQSAAYPSEKLPELYGRLVTDVAAVPGVVSAAIAECGLVSDCRSTSDVHFAGYEPRPGEQVRVQENYVGLNYFGTVGMRLIAGRDFSDRDTAKTPRVAIVSQRVARHYFPEGHALSKRFGYNGKAPDTEIIGIVEDARVNSVREEPPPMAYYAMQQGTIYGFSLEVRVAGDSAARVADIRKAVMAVDRNLPIERITTLAAQVDDNLRQDRLIFWLTSALGALALGLGCFGLYGVMSYAVAGRTGEWGIRMALGAPRSRLFGMVFGESALLIAAGLVAGLPFIFVAAGLVSGMLFGVKVGDPAPVCLAASALAVATMIAAYIPARRAARIQPMTALRYE